MNKQNKVEITPGLEGYAAFPKGAGPFPGVLVFMEAYGVTGHVRGVCDRLAQAGFVGLAPDFFHGELIAYDDMQAAMAKIATLKDEVLLQEVGAGLDWLLAQDRVRDDALGVIGFCMGGRLAYLSNCRFSTRLKAAVSFYGAAIAPEAVGPDRFGRIPPLGETAKMQAPLFLGYGAEDGGIPPAEHARVVAALSGAKKRYALNVYPGAGHAFLCEERANYAPTAAALAWRDAVDFLEVQLT
ncbi:MAG TPA: dienelactone hydrolase family protein [Gammaproteobacteria bacterium]|jgi:carboxymethylenebutenolidase|nr:dienelactone hydrolase family protein [Gammaproteobacteria bacterium]